MVQVTVGNNVKREKVIVDTHATLRSVLEDAGVDYTRGVMHLYRKRRKPYRQNNTGSFERKNTCGGRRYLQTVQAQA